MSSDIAISVDGLGKCYRIRHQAKRATSFAQAVRGVAAAPFKHLADRLRKPEETELFWALQDVSFEVRRGEVIGIIGRNGAGKSTLLKILSRITDPTTGHAEIRGRVNSLLEVGTGFHPELTGRENIFMNAAMHGMKRAEINTKLDEIIAFAEVEKFIDTPVKRYSSGMYTRLAFAVAAHLEPEILIVDEVLAVGDASFQKKCLGKMGEVARGGRTVLFVSHNMTAVGELCQKGILLAGGRIGFMGDVNEAVHQYSLHTERIDDIDLTKVRHGDRPREYGVLTRLSLFNHSLEPATLFYMGQSINARISIEIRRRMTNAEVGLKISSRSGIAIHYFCSTWEGLRQDLEPGEYQFEVCIPKIQLLPGRYLLGVWLTREDQWSDDVVQEVTMIEVLGSDVNGNAANFTRHAFSGCEVYAPSAWKMSAQANRSPTT